MRVPIDEINKANDAIESALAGVGRDGRGVASRSILGHLRNLVEHIAVYAVFGSELQCEKYFDSIKPSLEKLKKDRTTRFIFDFHSLLQRSVSHYTPSEEDSERLALGYYENMTLLRDYCSANLNVAVLRNLELYPLDTDPGLNGYYRSVAELIRVYGQGVSGNSPKTRYYIHSRKPFFIDGRVYYEYALVDSGLVTSNSDRIIAFSGIRIPDNNAVALSIQQLSIYELGVSIPVVIIDDWMTSIWPSELNKLLRIMGVPYSGLGSNVQGSLNSYLLLMQYMCKTGLSLNEIAILPATEFRAVIEMTDVSGKNRSIPRLLESARKWLLPHDRGSNVLAYLLYRPRGAVLDKQLARRSNDSLNGLFLKNGCIPFDRQPFCTSLMGHTPLIRDVFSCVDPRAHESDFLARFVSRASEETGGLYIDEKTASDFDDIDHLISEYNGALYCRHDDRRLIRSAGQLFIAGNETDVSSIVGKLLDLADGGIAGYSESCDAWLRKNGSAVDDERKRDALRRMFSNSKVGLIYGSAGTGKTTTVAHICAVMQGVQKIAIANTNSAVENLRQKIGDRNCDCMTIARYLSDPKECGLLIVDECSTVSNRDMARILKQTGFRSLLLVGDVRQIEAIRFGNWFALSKAFLPKVCVFDLEQSWRSADAGLSKVWDLVRTVEPGINEALVAEGLTSRLCPSLLNRKEDDEAILCLNYDGPYGINNLNRMLQGANPHKPVVWRERVYKVGDPVLFNDSNRFYPLLYNNLKGTIVKVEKPSNEKIVFSIALDLAISELAVASYQGLLFDGCDDGRSVVSFSVEESNNDPDNEARPNSEKVPFQVAYAISVHKAQGLEFDSVKVVVTKDVEKRFSHNIFYTAITRARKRLCIYWSPETQKYVLEHLEVANYNKDVNILSQRTGLKFRKCEW